MNIPQQLLYAKSHEWVKIDGNKAKIGISDYAQSSLGDIVFVNLPDIGDEFEIGASFAEVESVKAVSPIYSHLKGTIIAVNDALDQSPELLNEDCYSNWIVELEWTEKSSELMSAESYSSICES